MKKYTVAELVPGHIYENGTGLYEYSGQKRNDVLYTFYECHACDNGDIVRTDEKVYFTRDELNFE